MCIVLIGLNHQTAPVTVRERAAFSRDETAGALAQLMGLKEIHGALILSTCNRIEILAETPEEDGGIKALARFLHQFHSLEAGELDPFLYVGKSGAAVRHILRVACGLDSMVVGESQILGQLRDAYRAAQDAHCLGVHLNRLLLETFHTARKIRRETALSLSAGSVGQAAVYWARNILGALDDRTVLVLGAGKMSELAARHFGRAGVRRILFANRTYDRAAQLAGRFNGESIRFDHLNAALARADIVVSAAAAGYLISQADVERALDHRGDRPLLLIDVAVPRNVEPSVANLNRTHLCDIDGLAHMFSSRRPGIQNAVATAERMVEAAADAFAGDPDDRHVGHIIAELQSRIQSIGSAELERHICKLVASRPEDRQVLELMVRRIGNKILHPVIVELKRQARALPGNPDYIESLKVAFERPNVFLG